MNNLRRCAVLLGFMIMLPAVFLCATDGAADAHDWLGTCYVDWDNHFALTNVTAQARTTFAVPTGIGASGQREPCNDGHAACWTYRHRCFNDYINVEPMNYGHFHLSFEDPDMDCFTPDPGDGLGGGFGRGTPASCPVVDWSEERRVMNSHVLDHWIKIWLEDRVSHAPRVFDLPWIWVAGDQPIQFWFKKTDGSWWYWSELNHSTIWNVSKWVHDVVEVRIRGASSGFGPYTLNGFYIQD